MKGGNKVLKTQRYVGSELFHFVGRRSPLDHDANYRILSNILSQECITHYPHDPDVNVERIEFDWERSLFSEELVVPSVICFTDIPVESLHIHTQKYGKFGLSFDKGLLIRQRARPVTYIPMRSDDVTSSAGSSLLEDIESVMKGFNSEIIDKLKQRTKWKRVHGSVPDNYDDAVHALKSILLREFLAFLKPYNSELADDHPDNFYMEREWRRFVNFHFRLPWIKTVTIAQGHIDQLKTDFPKLNCQILEL